MVNKIISISICLIFQFSAFGQDQIELGDKREIFVDDYLIENLDGLEIVKHTPIDEGPVLTFDNPWEGNFSGYATIIKDGDIFRAYYRGIRVAGEDGNDIEVTCYAESKDGINWVKPNLNLFEIDGSLDNNVILANAAPLSHNFSPFLDSNPDAKPNQRYKALAGVQKSGLIAFTSPDGIHWKKLQEKPVFTDGIFDSQNVSFWSESEKKYICYFRSWSGKGYSGFRGVSRTTSEDFIHWTKPKKMTYGGAPLEHLYTNQTSPYYRAPQIYIAIGGRLMPGRQVLTDMQAKEFNVNPKYFKDCSDAFFMTSRGGNEYTRTFMESFIRPGIGLDNWVSRSNYPALNVVQTSPEEMSLYVNQDYAQPTANLYRYSLRIDGFSSISAPYSGGELITKPFTFTGTELEINYSTSAAGVIRFEIQDENGTPIPGYTMEDGQEIIGNEISRTVQWTGNKNLDKLVSKPVRLRIYMKDADLYSIKFTD
tara:strand:- start:5439 stop:6881 length:1443 start_codon:yes stop_codon:yes gene_type:complete